MRFSLFKKCSVLFVLFLSVSLVISCSKSGFKGTDPVIEEYPNPDPPNPDPDDPETGEYDLNKDGELSEEEFDEIKNKLGPMTFETKRNESDSDEINVTLSLYKIDGTKVSSKVKEKTTVKVRMDNHNVEDVYSSGENSYLCSLDNKNVMLEMSVAYGNKIFDVSEDKELLGGRDGDNTVWLGVDGHGCDYYFHNIDTVITAMKCPKAKKLKIYKLCEDTTLDQDIFRKCWAIPGEDNSCPDGNIYGSANCHDNPSQKYPVQCRRYKT